MLNARPNVKKLLPHISQDFNAFIVIFWRKTALFLITENHFLFVCLFDWRNKTLNGKKLWSVSSYFFIVICVSLEKGTLIVFTPRFQTAATALSSSLNISLDIRPISSESDSDSAVSDRPPVDIFVEEGELSDELDATVTDPDQSLSEEQSYRETMRGIRSFMG